MFVDAAARLKATTSPLQGDPYRAVRLPCISLPPIVRYWTASGRRRECKTSLASVNVLGLVSADALSSATSGSGASRQSQSSGQAAVTGNFELVGLIVPGQPVVNLNPNVALSSPGRISVIVNEQTSSPSGNMGAITVNALHVTGPNASATALLVWRNATEHARNEQQAKDHKNNQEQPQHRRILRSTRHRVQVGPRA